VTDGILQILNERELEAVLAHELSHVKNRDVLIATVAAGVAGLISTIGPRAAVGLMLGGAGIAQDDDRGGGLAALAWIIVAPIIALLIQLAISRSREYGADAFGRGVVRRSGRAGRALETLEQTKDSAPVRVRGSGDRPPVHRQPAARGRRGRGHGPALDPPTGGGPHPPAARTGTPARRRRRAQRHQLLSLPSVTRPGRDR